jgi:hypothetical protein
MALCAECKQKVEDGAVRCGSCGKELSPPGAFPQILGWVITAVSTIPFAVSEVTTADRNLVPLIVACCTLALGILLVVTGRVRAKASEPTTIPDPAFEQPINP